MNPTEAAALLTVCAGIDNRKPSAETARLWASMLDGLPYAECEAAVIEHYRESREWLMPADIRNRVRRHRAARITHDEALELPPHDPDDTAAHIAALTTARRAAADGRPIEAHGLVRRSIRELGGPVRRVNELDSELVAPRLSLARQAAEAARIEAQAAAKPDPEPLLRSEDHSREPETMEEADA